MTEVKIPEPSRSVRLVLVNRLKKDARLVLNVLVYYENLDRSNSDYTDYYYYNRTFENIARITNLPDTRLKAALGVLLIESDIMISHTNPADPEILDFFSVTTTGYYNHYADNIYEWELKSGLKNYLYM